MALELRVLSTHPPQAISFQDDSDPTIARLLRVLAHVISIDPDGAANVKKLWQHGGSLSVFYHVMPHDWTVQNFDRAWGRIDGCGDGLTEHFVGDEQIGARS